MNRVLHILLDNSRMEKETEEASELTPRQSAMYQMYEKIAEKFGKWDKGIGSNGAHYVEKSPFKSEGMVCSNCEYFEGGKGCEIVEGNIEANAICKLWIIKDSLLKPKM
jgi:hypothetical protein